MMLCVSLLGNPLNRLLRRGVIWWQGAVVTYVMAMIVCGWWEGHDYSWMDHAAPWRTGLYHLRLLCGVVLFVVSLRWFLSLFSSQQS
jgi:hypothetical protein